MILLTPEEALQIRAYVVEDPIVTVWSSLRLWRPGGGGRIRIVEATGRAHCRGCGARIEKGADAILFGFDGGGASGRPLKGHVADAYLHPSCPTDPEESHE